MDSDLRQILLEIIDSKLGSLSIEHLFILSEFVVDYCNCNISKRELDFITSFIGSFKKK